MLAQMYYPSRHGIGGELHAMAAAVRNIQRKGNDMATPWFEEIRRADGEDIDAFRFFFKQCFPRDV